MTRKIHQGIAMQSLNKVLTVAITSLALGRALAGDYSPIFIQHTQTDYINMGICAAVLRLEGGINDVRNLAMSVSLINPYGRVVERHNLKLEAIPANNAERIQYLAVESEAVCKDELSMRIDRATAQINGKPVDLLQLELLRIHDFKPMPIMFGKPNKS